MQRGFREIQRAGSRPDLGVRHSGHDKMPVGTAGPASSTPCICPHPEVYEFYQVGGVKEWRPPKLQGWDSMVTVLSIERLAHETG